MEEKQLGDLNVANDDHINAVIIPTTMFHLTGDNVDDEKVTSTRTISTSKATTSGFGSHALMNGLLAFGGIMALTRLVIVRRITMHRRRLRDEHGTATRRSIVVGGNDEEVSSNGQQSSSFWSFGGYEIDFGSPDN